MAQANFGTSSIDEFKNQLNIVDVIGRVVPLKRAGSNYKGCCPFHNEKTPSFVVSEQKQIFTCFGCSASGNVIEFTKRYYNLDFREAVEKLASENGIEFQFGGSGRENKERERLYEINKEAARFFYKAFTEQKNPGYAYMKKRGIDDSILKKFGIGFADGSWNSLCDYFKEKGVSEQDLLTLGLASKSEKDGRLYDKFRSRVMFPIINTSGKVIGFGGRTIEDAEPKYLNSPENLIFQKKNNLYGLNISKQDIGRENRAILVEGYMDVISLYQSGVHNVGASLGTALTDNQAKLIKRYTKNVALCYDADGAGRKAALRGIDILQAQELKVRVLHVTDGKDPDEFCKKHGREAFINLVDNASPGTEYKINSEKNGLNLNKEEDKLEYMKRVCNILRQVSPVEADIYIKRVAQDLKISENAIRRELNLKENPEAERRFESNRGNVVQNLSQREATVIKACLTNSELTEKLFDNADILSGSLAKKIGNLMFEIYGTKGSFEQADINDRLEPEESLVFLKCLEGVIIAGKEDLVIEDSINKWKLEKAYRRQKELIDMLSMAGDDTEKEAVDKLSREFMEVQKTIKELGRH